MTHRTADESKDRNIELMGERLGAQYSALWQQVVQLHIEWSEYVELFGGKSSIVLLNAAAPNFFHLLQDRLFEVTVLHISRLTDPPETGRKLNLTIQNLPHLIENQTLRSTVEALVSEAVQRSAFCRDWRNRRIAHNDLDLLLNQPVTPLESASRKQVNDAISAIANAMNAVQLHYVDGTTEYNFAKPSHGVVALLYALDVGGRIQKEKRERLYKGDYREDDWQSRDI